MSGMKTPGFVPDLRRDMSRVRLALCFSLLIFLRVETQTTITDCAPGSEWNNATSRCAPCRIGYYRTEGSRDQCVRCPDPGYITSREGSKSERDCDMPVGSRAKCPDGTEWISKQESCVLCPRGTYRTKGIHYWCVPCTEGTITPREGAVSRDECQVICPLGTAWNGSVSFCEPCPRDTYRNGTGSNSCMRCPDNHITLWPGSTSASECLSLPLSDELFSSENCPSGTEPGYDAANVSVCVVCPINTYRTAGVQRSCVSCSNNKVTWQAGATSDGSCVERDLQPEVNVTKSVILCPRGMEWQNDPEEGCYPCPRGTFKNATTDMFCTQCPGNHTTPRLGTKIIELCGLTEVPTDSAHGIFRTDECPLGTKWSPSDPRACISCPYGHYGSPAGQCDKCPDGLTTPRRGSLSVGECQLSSGSGENRPFFSTDMCPAGSEFSRVTSGCVPCPAGFYKTALEARCLSCDRNLTTLTVGSTSSAHCIVPREGPPRIASASYGCPEGYQPSKNSTECVICPLGTYKPVIGSQNCTRCSTGFNATSVITAHKGATSIQMCAQMVAIISIEPAWTLQSIPLEVAIQLSLSTNGVVIVKSATVGSQPCSLTQRIAVNGTVWCTVAPSRDAKTVGITVELHNGQTVTSSRLFAYKPDPSIELVGRTKVFASGGIDIPVTGEHFQSVEAVQMLLKQSGTTSRAPCSVVDDGSMICPSPNLTSWLSARRRSEKQSSGTVLGRSKRAVEGEPIIADLGFLFGDYRLYERLAGVLPEYGSLSVYPDPIIYEFPEQITTSTNKGDPLEMTLKGSYLNMGAESSDYYITVGNITCTLIEIKRNELSCRIDDNKKFLREGHPYPVKVRVGLLRYSPGVVVLSSPHTARSVTTASKAHSDATTTIGAGLSEDSDEPASSTRATPADDADTSPTTFPRSDDHVTLITESTSGRDGMEATNREQGSYLVPVLVSVAVVLLLGVVLVVVYFERKRRKKKKSRRRRHEADVASVDDLVCSISSSESDRSSTKTNDPSLPPLPVQSVFGPERRTDRGINQRSLAFPPDNIPEKLRSHMNKVKLQQPRA